MKIWIDMTAPAHPVLFRPLIKLFEADGHDVHITARDYGQTVGLLERMQIPHTRIASHGGASRAGKLAALVRRTGGMRRFGGRLNRSGRIDLAVGHGSNDVALVAKSLAIPSVNMFDYEWANIQHRIGCRWARTVITPDTIPAERLTQYGVDQQKLAQYPGLKEEYYLADFKADDRIVDELGIDRTRIVVTVRPPPEVALYHRLANAVFPTILANLGSRDDVHAVVIARTDEQREAIKALRLPSLIIPEHAVDAQSLLAFSDLAISAGGTMNREAVALGTPVYSTFAGRLGGVDEALIAENRLRLLDDPADIEVVKHRKKRRATRRDPRVLVDLILGQ